MRRSESGDEKVQVRLDQWLRAARFFKTRTLANEAINGGLVTLNGSRTKPSRLLQQGDELHITRGRERWHIVVMALSTWRGPAKEAKQLYRETDASRERREQEREQRRLQNAAKSRSEQKPDKKGRRKIIRFINKGVNA